MGTALSPSHLARDVLLIVGARIADSLLLLTVFTVTWPLSKLTEWLDTQSDSSAQRIAAAILYATK